MKVTIEPVREEDLAGVVGIERAAFSDPWSPQSFRDALDHPAVYFVAARDDAGLVVGYVVAWLVADEGEIANLAVAPEAWGGGVGAQLLDAALAEAVARGVANMYLEVRDSNERARRLYRSRGFEEVGRRRGYYRRPVEDAIVLRRTLTQMDV
ncbi:MAG TPA: ribosomal protein S18-alanine N-acetyltransferase [Gemmatimonadaceae bacterium]|nr:ribosomal protein S18-alanine N-acetyltransferase [Gemmatimonadaceae bacterium]